MNTERRIVSPMAILSSANLSKVQTGSSLPRVTKATTLAEALSSVRQRVGAVTLVSENDVIARRPVVGVILQGGANANILTGKDGSGRPHVSLRNQFYLCTEEQRASFLAGLATLTTVDSVLEAYYGFQDTHSINAVVWDNEAGWEAYKQVGVTFSGYLRADGTTGNVSIAGLTPEKPANPLRPKSLAVAETAPSAPATAPAPSAPAPAVPVMAGPPAPSMKVHPSDGKAYTPDQLRAGGWSDAQIAGLADA